ncbi:MAG: calcineurin-like phosphoesterase C-terminal domain-containing protein [Bacteroidales bacterium]|nr:calcineurin-like phosphoesterase C-terminal domain-containing protein [Bacteroidales bacterium]
MKNFRLFVLFTLSAFLLAVSCHEKVDPVETPKPIPANIILPSLIEIEQGKGGELQFRANPELEKSDFLVFKSVGGSEFRSSIVTLDPKTGLTFSLDPAMTAGYYTVYVLRGDQKYFVGKTEIVILSGINIDPDDGVTVFGIVSCEGKGVPGVVVSDGALVTVTDQNGMYQLKSEKKWSYVFMSVPSGYEPKCDGVLPEFHATLRQSANVRERKDFELKAVPNDKFTLFVLGDMHLANRTEDIKQFRQVCDDLNRSIDATSGPKYVLTLGDMTWDLYWYDNNFCFPEYIAEVNYNFKNIPFYHTMGNHDNDMNSTGDYNKAFRYTRDVAPTFYSYNIGKIHFIVLDDIDYNNVGTGSAARGDYVRDITAEQMDWLRKDLAYVDKSTPVYVSSHAPVFMPSGATGWRNNLTGANATGEANTDDLLNVLKDYKVHFLSGHTHNVFNYLKSDKWIEHNVGAVCASWWWSGHLTPGVHLSQDGAPGGYGVFSFDGKSMTHYYKASGWGKNYQFRAYDMAEVKKVITMASGGNREKFKAHVEDIQSYDDRDILINVWDYDPDWKISVTENGTELSLTPVLGRDPAHEAALTAKRFKSADNPSFVTSQWNHFFKVRTSSIRSSVVIKVTDRNGNVYTETMQRPKPFDLSDYTAK